MLKYIFLSALLSLGCLDIAPTQTPCGNGDSAIMHREADAFLSGLPVGLQQRQAEAVAAAIEGNLNALHEVRHTRNSSFAYSDNVEVSDLSIRGNRGRNIAMRLYIPRHRPDSTPLPLLIYFHGGGWTFGSLNSCARFCDALAATGKICVLAVDYALAPEYPYPEGLLDCMAAVAYARANCAAWGVSAQGISLGGDSSGGNLALASALNLCHRGGTPLKSLVLFYPVVLTEKDESASWRQYGNGLGLDAGLMTLFNEAYRGRNRQLHPHAEITDDRASISPLYASDSALRHLPPILLINAERDILCDQGHRFAQRITAAGGTIRHFVFPGTVHLFITVPGQDRAFANSVTQTVSFMTE